MLKRRLGAEVTVAVLTAPALAGTMSANLTPKGACSYAGQGSRKQGRCQEAQGWREGHLEVRQEVVSPLPLGEVAAQRRVRAARPKVSPHPTLSQGERELRYDRRARHPSMVSLDERLVDALQRERMADHLVPRVRVPRT